jgi:hypothetical protein
MERRTGRRGRHGRLRPSSNRDQGHLQALKERFPQRRAVVLFQPHRYSRTKILAEEFAVSFAKADVLGLLDIYAASEAPLPGVTSDWLADRIRAQGTAVTRLPAAGRACPPPRDGETRGCGSHHGRWRCVEVGRNLLASFPPPGGAGPD